MKVVTRTLYNFRVSIYCR